jgi:serine/threonine protein kinase
MTTTRKDSTYASREDPIHTNICLGCMSDKGDDAPCTKCGYNESDTETHQLRIKPRSILKNQYLIGRVLGQGGFGITYLGLDLILHKKVAIKEFMPSMLATRDSDKTSVVPYSGNMEQFFHQGLQSFIGEARSVANFSRHINIVNVNNYFEANNTGYMVMDYLEGEPVSKLIVKRGGRLSLRESFSILFPILEALGEVHKMEIYHRDISPQNIIVTTNDIPVLIDFGAARQIVGEQSYSLDVVLKHGYSPLEQYTSKGKIGPWSDVYACGATLYHMITGKLPPPAIDRVYSDELIQPCDIEGLSISEELNDTILTSLAVRISDRFQSVDELKEALEKRGHIGYRRLLDTFLRDKVVTLENRMTLDTFIFDYRVNHDDAKLIEETMREELSLPRLDWGAEYKENYERYLKEHPEGIQPAIIQKFHDTYVSTKRISRGKASELVKRITEAEAAQEVRTELAGVKAAPEEKAAIAEPGAPVASWKKMAIAGTLAAACIVVAVTAFFSKPNTRIEPVPAKIDSPNVNPTTSDQHGFINVWSKPPAEIYINGKLIGLSPLSKIEVPSGAVQIRLLNKEQNIDETYTEYVEPSSGQASN